MSRKRSRALIEQLPSPLLDTVPYDLGVLSKTKQIAAQARKLDRVLLKCDGKDIIKKSSVRKGRYLLAFAGHLTAMSAGRLGTLSELDSQTPVLYLDCSGGRIKMFGRLTFLKNKYVTLRVGAKSALCEDIFDMMVLFTTAWWVGTKLENPDENSLPFPDALETHDPSEDDVDLLDLIPGSQHEGKLVEVSRVAADEEAAQSNRDEFSDAELTQAATQPSSQTRSARRMSAKRPCYVEASQSSGSSPQSDSSADSSKLGDDQELLDKHVHHLQPRNDKQSNIKQKVPAAVWPTAIPATISLLSSGSDAEGAGNTIGGPAEVRLAIQKTSMLDIIFVHLIRA